MISTIFIVWSESKTLKKNINNTVKFNLFIQVPTQPITVCLHCCSYRSLEIAIRLCAFVFLCLEFHLVQVMNRSVKIHFSGSTFSEIQ